MNRPPTELFDPPPLYSAVAESSNNHDTPIQPSQPARRPSPPPRYQTYDHQHNDNKDNNSKDSNGEQQSGPIGRAFKRARTSWKMRMARLTEENSTPDSDPDREKGVTELSIAETLYTAAQHRDKETIKEIILDSPPTIRKMIESMALTQAALARREDILAYILDLGADINGTYWAEQTPLCKAVLKSNSKAVTMILTHGGDVQAKTRSGMTPFLYAAEVGFILIMEQLLENGAQFYETNHDGRNALHLAASNGKNAAVQVLLSGGMDIHARDKMGRTPLDLAMMGGQEDTVKLLNGFLYRSQKR